MPKGGRFRGAGDIVKGVRELEALEHLAARGTQRGHVDLGGGGGGNRLDPHMGETAISPGGIAVPADVARDRAAQLAREAEETARRTAESQSQTQRAVDHAVNAPAVSRPLAPATAGTPQPHILDLPAAPEATVVRDASAMTRTRPAAPAPAAPTRVEVTVNNNGTTTAAPQGSTFRANPDGSLEASGQAAEELARNATGGGRGTPRAAAHETPEAHHSPVVPETPKIPAVDLTAGRMDARTELPGYIRTSLQSLQRQTGKGGDHIALDAMQTQFADALRANGRLIDKRVFRKELSHPKAVEDRIRAGKDVTEGEYGALVNFQHRKLEAGPAAKEADLLKDVETNARNSLTWRAQIGSMARSLVLRNPTPSLRDSINPLNPLSYRYAGGVSALALATGLTASGVAGYNSADTDPARMTVGERVAEGLTNFPGLGDNYGYYIEQKFNYQIQPYPDRVAKVGSAVANKQAPEPVMNFYNFTQAQSTETLAQNANQTAARATEKLASSREKLADLVQGRMEAATSGLGLDAMSAMGSADPADVKSYLGRHADPQDAASAAKAIDKATRGGHLTASTLCKAFEDPALKSVVKDGPTGGAVAQGLNQVHRALDAPCPTLR